MCLDIALAVACGGVALGALDVDEGGSVLYLALEDNFRRLQSRALQMTVDGVAGDLQFAVECARLDDGGLDFIRARLRAMRNPRLLVVDVLGKVRKPGGRDPYASDYAAIEPIKRLAAEWPDLAILLVHHVSKRQDAEDVFDLVSGSTGLTGSVDACWIFTRDKTGNLRLTGRGRDIAEFDLAVSFDQASGAMTLLGNAQDVLRSTERNSILAALANADGALRPKDISDLTDMSVASVQKLLGKLAQRGEVVKAAYGKYQISSHPNSDQQSEDVPSFGWKGYQ